MGPPAGRAAGLARTSTGIGPASCIARLVYLSPRRPLALDPHTTQKKNAPLLHPLHYSTMASLARPSVRSRHALPLAAALCRAAALRPPYQPLARGISSGSANHAPGLSASSPPPSSSPVPPPPTATGMPPRTRGLLGGLAAGFVVAAVDDQLLGGWFRRTVTFASAEAGKEEGQAK